MKKHNYQIRNYEYDYSKLDYRFINAARQRNRLAKKWNKAFNNSHNPRRTLRGFNYWSKIEIKLSDKIRYWENQLQKFKNC